jgi:hypothetical protein
MTQAETPACWRRAARERCFSQPLPSAALLPRRAARCRPAPPRCFAALRCSRRGSPHTRRPTLPATSLPPLLAAPLLSRCSRCSLLPAAPSAPAPSPRVDAAAAAALRARTCPASPQSPAPRVHYLEHEAPLCERPLRPFSCRHTAVGCLPFQCSLPATVKFDHRLPLDAALQSRWMHIGSPGRELPGLGRGLCPPLRCCRAALLAAAPPLRGALRPFVASSRDTQRKSETGTARPRDLLPPSRPLPLLRLASRVHYFEPESPVCERPLRPLALAPLSSAFLFNALCQRRSSLFIGFL